MATKDTLRDVMSNLDEIKKLKQEIKELKAEKQEPENYVPKGEIDLDDSLYRYKMDWSFDKPNIPHTVVYIFNKEDDDCMKCTKCNKYVPLGYLNGKIDNDFDIIPKWAECIHTGWYCPNHSPTSNCQDGKCPLCNLGYDEEEDKDE